MIINGGRLSLNLWWSLSPWPWCFCACCGAPWRCGARICLDGRWSRTFTSAIRRWATLCWPSPGAILRGCTPWICRPTCPTSCPCALSQWEPRLAISTSLFASSWSLIKPSTLSRLNPSLSSLRCGPAVWIPSPQPSSLLTVELLFSFYYDGALKSLAIQ